MTSALTSIFKARWFRFGLIGLVAFFLIFSVLAYMLVDTRKVASVASTAVQKSTGRALTINGPVSLKLFPQLSIVAEDVSFGNATWAADPAMAKAEKVFLKLDWMPLLHEQILINEVMLSGVTLNLQSAPAGQKVSGNWNISAPDSGSSKSSSGSEAFNLHALEFSNATINIRNAHGALTQSIVINEMTGSLSDTQADFSGHITWQQQAIDLKGVLGYKTDAPLDLTLNVQSDKIDLKPANHTASKLSDTNKNSRWVFDPETLGFDLLPMLNGHITANIKSFVLPSGVVLPNLDLQATLDVASGGVLTINRFKTGLGQGVINADGKVSGYSTARPHVALRGHAEGFTIDKVLAQANAGMKPSDFQGGPGEFAFNLNTTGTSMRDLAAAANGQVQLSVGPARASGAFINEMGDFTLSLFNAINPLSKSLDYAQLECAVAYLPLSNGQIKIDQSIGIQTERLNVTLDGQVNLRDETQLINIYPKERSGLTTGVNPAGLVQIQGSLRNPTLGVNKTGVVSQAANVGLAVVTAGISLAVQNAASVVTRSNPCENVLKPWSSIDGGLSKR